MFTGTVPLIIEKLLTYDDFGQASVSATFKSSCAVVKLINRSEKTIARMSQSASLGNASEYVADAVLLVAPNAPAELGDRLTVKGLLLLVDEKNPRDDVSGRLDHYELRCSKWAS